jgi:hypothetical protein
VTDLSPESAEALRLFNSWKHRQRPPVPADDTAREPQHIYAELMKTDFAPALRKAGLRGSNGRFELGTLGFQKSVSNSHDEVQFTINLSVIRRDEWTSYAATSSHLDLVSKLDLYEFAEGVSEQRWI